MHFSIFLRLNLTLPELYLNISNVRNCQSFKRGMNIVLPGQDLETVVEKRENKMLPLQSQHIFSFIIHCK
jgi:hypothetical protein